MHFLMITDKAAYVPFPQALRTSSCQNINSLEVHRLGPNLSSFLRSISYRLFGRSLKPWDDMLAANLCREAANLKGIEKVDVFHLHGIWKPLYPNLGLFLSQRFHRPLVVTLHGDSVDPVDPFSMPIRAPATLQVLRKATFISTFSNETLDLLLKLKLGKTSRLIPNFVNANSFKRPTSRKNGSGTKIVMVSRLSKPKDPITPIRAFAKVVKAVPEATLRIVGYGPLYDDANGLVHDLNLEGSVTMVGMKSDVREFLWDSDIAIGTRGSYITTLEAWAAGLAVVAPDFGIMREIICNGENGLLSAPGNSDQLASDLISLIKNKSLRTMIAKNGEDTAEKHDIKSVAPLIADIYKGALTVPVDSASV